MRALLTVDDLGFEAPSLPAKNIASIAESLFGITGEFRPLHGERDQNTRITTSNGKQYVLKISGAAERPGTVDFQVQALLHIAHKDPGIPVPRLVAGTDGNVVQSFEVGGAVHLVRLLSFLPGVPYSSGPFPSCAGLRQIGSFLARLDLALADFSHPASGEFMPWDICNGLVISDQFRNLIDETEKSLCEPLIDHVAHETYPRLGDLRRQVIHQDAHGSNLLRESAGSEEITGIIDFGDMVAGPLISDVVITVSHFMESGEHPFDIASAVCEGYSAVSPLQNEETDLLLDLVIARQLLTLQLFEFRRHHMPNEPALDADEKPRIIRSLTRLSALNRQAFAERLRPIGSGA